MSKLYTRVIRAVTICLFCCSSLTTFAKEKYRYQKLDQFIPTGFELLDSASGDLNADGFFDYVLVLRNKKENITPGSSRPLLVLLGTAKGSLEVLARNDKVILCSDCGGMFGDPYQKITIRDASVFVEHTVGASWRWSRIITFRYNSEIKNLILHNDENFSYKEYTQVRQSNLVSNTNDFDKLPFIYFTYNKGY